MGGGGHRCFRPGGHTHRGKVTQVEASAVQEAAGSLWYFAVKWSVVSERKSQKMLIPQPDSKHIYDPCNATQGAESTQPFHFILLKLRLASFYELLHKSY